MDLRQKRPGPETELDAARIFLVIHGVNHFDEETVKADVSKQFEVSQDNVHAFDWDKIVLTPFTKGGPFVFRPRPFAEIGDALVTANLGFFDNPKGYAGVEGKLLLLHNIFTVLLQLIIFTMLVYASALAFMRNSMGRTLCFTVRSNGYGIGFPRGGFVLKNLQLQMLAPSPEIIHAFIQDFEERRSDEIIVVNAAYDGLSNSQFLFIGAR